jgi:hypothetical protein
MLEFTLVYDFSGVVSGVLVPAQRCGRVLGAVAVVGFQHCVAEGVGVAIDPFLVLRADCGYQGQEAEGEEEELHCCCSWRGNSGMDGGKGRWGFYGSTHGTEYSLPDLERHNFASGLGGLSFFLLATPGW